MALRFNIHTNNSQTMFYIKNTIAALIGLTIIISACKTKTDPAETTAVNAPTPVPTPAGFEEFYQKFHADSLYQIAHISWPLQGGEGFQKDSTSTGLKDASWTLDGWRFQNLKGMSPNEFDREVNVISEGLIIEKIKAKAVPFGIERRFAKQANGEWELIYYADVHEFKK
jgi:hypothetical protein